MEKIKKSLRKEDGFTLVELLAVIVILGIILAIAIPAIGNVIEKSRGDATDAENALILDAARLYYTINDTDAGPITVGQLVEDGFLEDQALVSDNRNVYKLANGSVSFTNTPGGN